MELSFRLESTRLERRIVMLDFEILRIWYAVARHISLANGRKSLQEMTSIIAHLANFMGERALAHAD